MVRVDVHIVQDARGDNYITARRVPVSSTAVGKSVNGWILNGGAFISFAGQFNPPSWSATCGGIACFPVIVGSLLQKGHSLETWILITFSDRLLPCIWDLFSKTRDSIPRSAMFLLPLLLPFFHMATACVSRIGPFRRWLYVHKFVHSTYIDKIAIIAKRYPSQIAVNVVDRSAKTKTRYKQQHPISAMIMGP